MNVPLFLIPMDSKVFGTGVSTAAFGAACFFCHFPANLRQPSSFLLLSMAHLP